MLPRFKFSYWLLPIFILASCFGMPEDKSLPAKKTTAKTISVVELFTSEGCSSCPPADRLLGKLKEEGNAIVLSYHVDYWDHLGWKDPFSQALFSDRQRQYAQRFHLESIYTPQAVINGAEEFVGSDESHLRTSLQKTASPDAIALTTERKDAATVSVHYMVQSSEPQVVQMALVQPQATTVVKRGENGGKTLQHTNVVRLLKTVETTSGQHTAELKIPEPLQTLALDLVLFTQQKGGGKITGAAKESVPLSSTALQ